MPSRLKLYCARSLNKKEELLPQLAHQQIGYEAASLKNLRWSAAEVRYEVLVSWRGFETTDNMWEPLETALENVPALVHRLLSKHPESRLVARFVVRSPCWSSRATVCWFAVASVGHFCASKRLNGGGATRGNTVCIIGRSLCMFLEAAYFCCFGGVFPSGFSAPLQPGCTCNTSDGIIIISGRSNRWVGL
jgi:hypothetical protein